MTVMTVTLPTEDPFVRKELPSQTAKAHGGLRAAMIGAENTVSHPRGNLFDDDDVGLEDTGPEEEDEGQGQGQSGRQGNVLSSDPVNSPLQRVVSGSQSAQWAGFRTTSICLMCAGWRVLLAACGSHTAMLFSPGSLWSCAASFRSSIDMTTSDVDPSSLFGTIPRYASLANPGEAYRFFCCALL